MLDRATFARVAPISASLALHLVFGGIAAVVVPRALARVPDVINVDLIAVEPPRVVEAPPAPAAPKRVSPPKPVAAPLPKIEERPAPGPDRGPSPAPSPVPVVTPPSASPGVGGAEPSKGVSLIDTPVPRTTAPSQVASIPRDTGITHVAHPTGGYQVRPGYPSSAKRLGIQGTTMLRVYVLEDGRVGDVVVDASAGHADMDQAAADAVRRWRFDPARRGTEKVAMWVRIPFEFKLR